MSRQQGIQDDIMRHLMTGPAQDTTELSMAMSTDREKITGAVSRLHERGWVALDYRRNPNGGRPVFHNIRLTDDGLQNMPDPIPHAQAGTKFAHQLPSSHPGDMTDYRNHPSTTTGSPVVRTIVTPKTTPTPLVVARVVDSNPTGTIGRAPYPILQELSDRNAQVEPLRRAAAVLAPADPLRKELERRINDKMAALTPIEHEYMRYANAHRDQ